MNIETEIAEQVAVILQVRPSSHGDFKDNARISQALKHVLHSSPNWDELPVIQREALDMIAVKLSRIVSGDPNFDDHWSDIVGYVHLAVKR